MSGRPVSITGMEWMRDVVKRLTALERRTSPADLPGSSLIYTGTVLPPGYLWEDGSAVSRATYARLFSVIGTTYGAGNGTTTFNLPNNPKGQTISAVGTTAQAGASSADLIYTGALLTLTSGTWEIEGGIQGQTNVLDAQVAAMYNVTANAEVPSSRGEVVVTGAPPDAHGIRMRSVTLTLTATTQFRMVLCRNGASTPSVIAAGIASAPAAWMDARRVPYNIGAGIIKF